MNRRLMCAAFAALVLSTLAPGFIPAAARAAGRADATGFTTAAGADAASEAAGALMAAAFEASPVTRASAIAWSRYEPHGYASRYRPRRERYDDGGSDWLGHSVAQIHAGFFDPDGPAGAGFLVGLRGGQQLDDMLQIGVGVDWRNKSGRATQVLQQTTGPGGEVIQVQRDLSRYSSNLFPALAYIQLSGPSNMPIVPYAGVAASWQILFLSADDFQTGQSFDATFDGFGWQAWAGAALPLSGRSRLLGEVFVNNADLGRDTYDAASNSNVHETVSTDGMGARFGVSWGF